MKRFNGILRPAWRDLRKVLARSHRQFIIFSTAFPTTATKETKPEDRAKRIAYLREANETTAVIERSRIC